MRISDWSSDVCSSDLLQHRARVLLGGVRLHVLLLLEHRVEEAPGRERVGRGRLEQMEDQPAARLRERDPQRARREIGRESCRESGGQYVEISVVAVQLKKKP